MRLLITKCAAVAAVFAGLTPAIQGASAMPVGNLAPVMGDAAPVEKTQFFWGGQNYCFYPDGWRGPGYYWCGYAWRRGFGWGGGPGWHGWHGGGGGGHGFGGHPGGGHPGGGHPGGGHGHGGHH